MIEGWGAALLCDRAAWVLGAVVVVRSGRGVLFSVR